MTGPSPVPPPPPTRRDEVVELRHGTAVADPYRWLEDGHDAEVRAWVDAQNERTDTALHALAGRAERHQRLQALLRAGSSVACHVAGGRVFSLERWGLHDQAVLVCRSATLRGPARTLVDPHASTGDPTAAVDWYHPSPDGRRVAYGISRGGDERSTLHVLDVETGRNLRDRITNTRACSVAWLPDGSAFAYTRYPDPLQVPVEDRGYWRKVYWHRVGDPPHRDELVWGDLPDKTAWPNVSISPDGRWMLVHLSLGWSRVDVHLIDRRTGARTVLIEGIEAVSTFTVVDDHLVGVTTLDADRGRVVVAPLATPWHEHWATIVPESDAVLETLTVTPRSLLVLGSRSAVSFLDRYDHDGSGHGSVKLPGLGSLAGLSGSRERDEVFFSFTSFARPPSLLRWTPQGVSDWSRLHDDDDGAEGRYVVEQVRYPSPDGTEIPMFLIRAADLVPGPDTPCILTGYGGFSITMGPAYSAAIVSVCEQGGLYAVANVRGGAEEGEAWHRAGMLENKQRSFDDFIAAADWLVEQGYTSRGRLALRAAATAGCWWGGDHPAPRPVPGRADRRAAARHGALPPLPHRPAVDPRVRRPGSARRLPLAARLLALPPRRRRHLLPRRPAHHRRGRLPRRPHARPEDGGPTAGGELLRGRPPRPAAHRARGHGQGKPLSKQADEPTCSVLRLAARLAPPRSALGSPCPAAPPRTSSPSTTPTRAATTGALRDARAHLPVPRHRPARLRRGDDHHVPDAHIVEQVAEALPWSPTGHYRGRHQPHPRRPRHRHRRRVTVVTRWNGGGIDHGHRQPPRLTDHPRRGGDRPARSGRRTEVHGPSPGPSRRTLSSPASAGRAGRCLAERRACASCGSRLEPGAHLRGVRPRRRWRHRRRHRSTHRDHHRSTPATGPVSSTTRPAAGGHPYVPPGGTAAPAGA
ncbi:MAG: prolyl oligopeptidase family serine peptidase [Acidimicrobiales bacterium]